ncbi:hypothetical protein [Catenulispora subtropica]|uniref:Uncharacterized protein n=1 Tax=Catenulispora subtropica TaxID=450798 RepID=A0ABP5C8J1_9ACTN
MSEQPAPFPLMARVREIQESIRTMDAAEGWGSDAIRDALLGLLASEGLPMEEPLGRPEPLLGDTV